MTITYEGQREEGGCRVVKHGRKGDEPLPLRLDLANHSPTGFEWGYAGSGPAQLALAILADALRNGSRARRLHQRFKFAIVSGLPRERWKIERSQVLAIVRTLEADEGADNRRPGNNS